MGRKRRKDRDLPQCMYRKHGAFWLVRGGKWTRLAPLDDFASALARYAELQETADDTLAGAISRYAASGLRQLSPRTQADYRAALSALAEWAGHLSLSAIKPTDVSRYLVRCRPKSVANRRIAVLSSVYRAEIEAGRCEVNPCLGVPKHKQAKRTTVPSHLEIDGLRDNLSPAMQTALDLALATALRLGDLLALTRSDLVGEGLRAPVSKTGNVILFKWTAGLREIIDRCGDPVLIPNTKGDHYTVSGFESVWQRAKKKAGFPHIRWHDLRARALTDAHRARGLDYAQALAAHASATTTERYLREKGEVVVEPLR